MPSDVALRLSLRHWRAWLVVAAMLLAVAIAAAEWAFDHDVLLPAWAMFGIPAASALLSLLASRYIKQLQRQSMIRPGRANAYVAAALAFSLLASFLLGARYRADYDSIVTRTAPDGSRVVSVSWTREGHRYFERINDRFVIERSAAQYQKVVIKQQRAFFGVLLFFAALAPTLWIAGILLVRRASHGPHLP